MGDDKCGNMDRSRLQKELEVNTVSSSHSGSANAIYLHSYSSIQAAFCPPLDTTVVAALTTDYLEDDGTIKTERLQILRDQLSDLAASAAADQLDELAGLRIDGKDTSASINDSPDSDSLLESSGDAGSV